MKNVLVLLVAFILFLVPVTAQTGINLSSTNPPAPSGNTLVKWQHDKTNPDNISGYVPDISGKADQSYVDSQDATKQNLDPNCKPDGNGKLSCRIVEVGTTVVPIPAKVSASAASAVIVDGGNRNVAWMSADRSTLYGGGYNSLYKSVDDGANWTLLKTFSGTLYGVRELDNGELLASIYSDGATPGTLWLSSGYPRLGVNATWTKVLTASGANENYIQPGWGLNCYKTICVASEYGSKLAASNAGKVYLSTDSAATWTTILDLTGTEGLHIHGAQYDPWWDAIWVVNGDGSAGNELQSLRVSFDRGAHWTIVTQGASATQYTGIFPMENVILFTTDGTPNGVHRIVRTLDRSVSAPEVAYRLNSSTALTHVGGQPFRAKGANMPVLIPWVANSGPGLILATYDGYNFTTIFTDSVSYVTKGPQVIVGPTLSGKLIGSIYDDRQANFSRLTLQAPPTVADVPATTPRVLFAYAGTTDAVNCGAAAYTDAATKFTLPPNYLTPGKLLRVTIGYGLTTSGSPPQMALYLRTGTTNLWGASAFIPVGNIGNRSGGTTLYIQGSANPSASAAVYTNPLNVLGSSGEVTGGNSVTQPVNLATNAAITLAPGLWCSAATAGNSVIVQQLIVEALN